MDRMRPLKDYTGLGSSGLGAWEVGFRYSKIDANDFEPNITTTLTATKVDAYTAGIKWIIDPNTRVLFNYIFTDYGRKIAVAAVNGTNSSDHEGAVNVRAQFDF
jgi:phosphate-selective porin OprO and OprP